MHCEISIISSCKTFSTVLFISHRIEYGTFGLFVMHQIFWPLLLMLINTDRSTPGPSRGGLSSRVGSSMSLTVPKASEVFVVDTLFPWTTPSNSLVKCKCPPKAKFRMLVGPWTSNRTYWSLINTVLNKAKILIIFQLLLLC